MGFARVVGRLGVGFRLYIHLASVLVGVHLVSKDSQALRESKHCEGFLVGEALPLQYSRLPVDGFSRIPVFVGRVGGSLGPVC